MRSYSRYTEENLVRLAAEGDAEAVVELMLVRYRQKLESAARSINANMVKDDIDDAIQNFTERNIKCDSNGNWRLRGLSAEHNPLGYVMRSFQNYLRDEFRKDKLDIVEKAPEEGRTGDDESRGGIDTCDTADDSYGDSHPKTHLELQIAAIFEALDGLRDITPRERYILVTFLLSERYRGNGARPLKIREELGEQLGENASTVYNRYADLKHQLQERAAAYLRRLREE